MALASENITAEVIYEIVTIPLIFEVEMGAKRIANSALHVVCLSRTHAQMRIDYREKNKELLGARASENFTAKIIH